MNSNPKIRAKEKFLELFGDKNVFEVVGHRERLDWPGSRGGYRTQLIIDDCVVVEALDRDWRKSYKKLTNEIENLYAAGLSLV